MDCKNRAGISSVEKMAREGLLTLSVQPTKSNDLIYAILRLKDHTITIQSFPQCVLEIDELHIIREINEISKQ